MRKAFAALIYGVTLLWLIYGIMGLVKHGASFVLSVKEWLDVGLLEGAFCAFLGVGMYSAWIAIAVCLFICGLHVDNPK
jgi:hypothetical protein